MKNIIKSNKRFELFEIRNNTNVYCTVCQIIMKEDVEDQVGLFEHYFSLQHIDNLTNKILAEKQSENTKNKKKDQQLSELFNYTKAEKKLKKSQECLKSYFTQCILDHPKMLEGLEPQTVKAYLRELRNFYIYLFEKKHMSTVNTEIIMEYIEDNNYTHKQSAVMRLFKGFNIPFKYQVKQKVQQLIEERKIKKISFNSFQDLQERLIQHLEDKKHIKEALAIILSKQGMPPEEVHRIQVKTIKLDTEVQHLVQMILQQNPESYLFDNKKNFTQQTKDFLDFRKHFLKSYHEDEEFQQFIRNASLRTIYEINKRRKQNNEQQNQKNIDQKKQLSEQYSNTDLSNEQEGQENLFVELASYNSEPEQQMISLREESVIQQSEDSKEQSLKIQGIKKSIRSVKLNILEKLK